MESECQRAVAEGACLLAFLLEEERILAVEASEGGILCSSASDRSVAPVNPLARDPDMAHPELEEMGVVTPYPGDLVRGEP